MAIAKVDPTALVEVVAVRAVEQNETLEGETKPKKVLYLYVDVNILPTEYTSQGIAHALQVSQGCNNY